MRPCGEFVKQGSGSQQIQTVRFEKGCAWRAHKERHLGGNASIDVSIAAKSYKNQPLALCSFEDGGAAFD
jgi:hypothetical protein